MLMSEKEIAYYLTVAADGLSQLRTENASNDMAAEEHEKELAQALKWIAEKAQITATPEDMILAANNQESERAVIRRVVYTIKYTNR